MKNETDFYRAVTNLDVDIELVDDDGFLEIHAIICHPESGTKTEIKLPYDPYGHPKFDRKVGNELYSWAELMWDEYNEEGRAS